MLLNVVPARWFSQVSVHVQGLLTGLFLLGGLFSWSMKEWDAETIAKLPETGIWFPPVWFTGLHRLLIDDRDPLAAHMATRALWAAGISVVSAIAAYVISYRRYRTLLLESPIRLSMHRWWRGDLLRWLAGSPRREA